MLDLVLVCAFVAVIAIAVLFHYITKAPEGYQDSGGFRFGPRPDSDGKGVSVSDGRSLGASSASNRVAARQSQPSHHSSLRGY